MDNNQQNKISPAELFLSLGILISLVISFISFFVIFSGIVDYRIGNDLLQNNYREMKSIASFAVPLSLIFVFSPILCFLSIKLKKFYKINPERLEKPFYKWVKHIILFFCILVFAIDLVTVLNRFFSGDISLNFWIKALFVFVLAYGTGFYFKNLNKNNKINYTKVIEVLFVLLFLAIIIFSFVTFGGPIKAKNIKQDNLSVEVLNNYSNSINNYYTENKKLPEDIDSLKIFVNNKLNKVLYTQKSEKEYELCTDFLLERRDSDTNYLYSFYNENPNFNDHPKGKACFALKVIETKDNNMIKI